ncbi:MAG: chemotaxis protein CheX [Planctomycetes bacterium]|nr:chemotaxis protein CheX [Planctomycetota bacterium]
MPKITNDLLIEALTEALETTAFMMALPPEEEMPSPTQGVLVRIDFNGPVSGTVELWTGSEFSQMIAANIMGIEPDDEEAQTKSIDAVKELVNIIGGVLLTKLTDSPSDMFNLTVPRAQEHLNSEAWEEYIAQDDVTVLDVEGFPVATRLLITASANLPETIGSPSGCVGKTPESDLRKE